MEEYWNFKWCWCRHRLQRRSFIMDNVFQSKLHQSPAVHGSYWNIFVAKKRVILSFHSVILLGAAMECQRSPQGRNSLLRTQFRENTASGVREHCLFESLLAACSFRRYELIELSDQGVWILTNPLQNSFDRGRNIGERVWGFVNLEIWKHLPNPLLTLFAAVRELVYIVANEQKGR